MKSKRYKLYPDREGLLSHSGMNTFLSCPRKFGYKYYDDIEKEEVDTTAMDRGRTFHTLVEHDGDISDGELLDELERNLFELAKVKTAFKKFKSYKDRKLIPNFDIKELRIESQEKQFLGYVDSMGVNDDTGKFMLGELKTTSSFDALKWGLLPMNSQVALYTSNLGEFAHENFLDLDDFGGVSYTSVTMTKKKPLLKSAAKKLTKASRRHDETPAEYQERIKDDTEIYSKIFSPTKEAIFSVTQTFEKVKEAIHELKGDSSRGCKNTNSCFDYFRPCEFFTTCHGLSPYGADEKQHKQETSIENDM